MRNVLFVSDLFVGGGLETRILGQVKYYHEQGIRCFLAAEEYDAKLAKAFDGVRQVQLTAKDGMEIVAATDELVKFGREAEAEMLDVHPKYGVVPACMAAGILGVPMSFTSHSPYTMLAPEDKMTTLYHLVLELKRPQIFVVANYLKKIHADEYKELDVKLMRNGVAIPAEMKRPRKVHPGKWVMAARLCKEKTEPFIQALPVLEKAGVKEVEVFGDGECREELKRVRSGVKVKVRGWTKSVSDEVRRGGYEGGIAMDRVAMEMMALGLPVMLVGYKGLAGGVTAENFEKLSEENFSTWETMSEEKVLEDFEDMRRRPEVYDMREMVKRLNSEDGVWGEYLRVVESLKTDPGRDAMVRFFWDKFYRCESYARQLGETC